MPTASPPFLRFIDLAARFIPEISLELDDVLRPPELLPQNVHCLLASVLELSIDDIGDLWSQWRETLWTDRPSTTLSMTEIDRLAHYDNSTYDKNYHLGTE